jgi:hypothetical protein
VSELAGKNNPSRRRRMEEPGTPDLGKRNKRKVRRDESVVSFYPPSISRTGFTHLQRVGLMMKPQV